MTEMYEDKGDGSCFLKDSSREGLNFIVLVQEESFLYCEYRRLSIQHELGKLHVFQREKELLWGLIRMVPVL